MIEFYANLLQLLLYKWLIPQKQKILNPKQHMNHYNFENQKITTTIGKYRVECLIASGTFGKVFMTSFMGKRYAIKQMLQPTDPHLKQQMENEIQVLADLNHENIVKLYEVIRERYHVYLVMEFCQSDMRQLMNNKAGYYEEDEAHRIFIQIVNGMNELVKLRIVHRDLKPANILYTKGVFKLADFGLAKYVQNEDQLLKTRVGTPFYMAPQILLNEKYTSKCDIWSLGVIFYQLVFGRIPWYATREDELISKIHSVPVIYSKDVSLKTRRLLQGMLAIDEYRRFSWQELLAEINTPLYEPGFEMEKTFHKSTMEKLLNLQLNRISQASFGRKMDLLKTEQKKSVVGLVNRLFNEASKDLCGHFIKAKTKV